MPKTSNNPISDRGSVIIKTFWQSLEDFYDSSYNLLTFVWQIFVKIAKRDRFDPKL